MKEVVHRHIYGTQLGDSPPFAIWPVELKWSSSKQINRSLQGQFRQRQTLSAESTSLGLHHSRRARQRARIHDALDLHLSRGPTPVTEATDEAKEDRPIDKLRSSNSVSEEGCTKRQSSSLHVQLSPQCSWRPNSRKILDESSRQHKEQYRMILQESKFASRIPRWKGLSKRKITGSIEDSAVYLPDRCEPPQRSLMKPVLYELSCEDRFGGIGEHMPVKASFNESSKAQAAFASWNIVTEDPFQHLSQSAAGVLGLTNMSLHEKQGTYYENQVPDSAFFGPLVDGHIYELSALKEETSFQSIRQYPSSSSRSTISSNSNTSGPFYSETVIASPQAMFHPCVDQIPASLSGHICCRLRPCYILIFLGVLVIAGSLAPALWRSTKEDDISGGFGLAQYILGVGVFAVGSMVAIHSRRCSCWRS